MFSDKYYHAACEDMRVLMDEQKSNTYNTTVIIMGRVCENVLKSACEILELNVAVYENLHVLRNIYRWVMDVCKKQEYYISEPDLSYLSEFRITAEYPGDDYIVVTEDEKDYCSHILNNVLEWYYDFRTGRGLSATCVVDYLKSV